MTREAKSTTAEINGTDKIGDNTLTVSPIYVNRYKANMCERYIQKDAFERQVTAFSITFSHLTNAEIAKIPTAKRQTPMLVPCRKISFKVFVFKDK